MGTHIRAGTSRAGNADVPLERGSPQKTLYPARSITTTVKTLVRMAMTAAHHIPALARARYMVSLLQNPFSGGKPAIAKAPRRKQALVTGICFLSPPS